MGKQIVWKSLILKVGIACLLFVGPASCGSAQSLPDTQAQASETAGQSVSATIAATKVSNLDDDASQWGIYYDGGSATASVRNVSKPSVDGTSLEVSLTSGQPYVGIHAYRNLAPADTALTFNLALSFYFPAAIPIQALEFTTSKWVNNQRWEWAMQWERIGIGVTKPVWRLWTGSSWQSINVTQQLGVKEWHRLSINGNIANGMIHYISFKCDDTSATLDQTFNSVSNPGDKLALAVQLDGDSQEDPYQLYIDQVSLQWI